MAKSRGVDPMVELLRAIKDATRENTSVLKLARADERLRRSEEQLVSQRQSVAAEKFRSQQAETYQRSTAYTQVGMGSVGAGMNRASGFASGLQGLGFEKTASFIQGRAGAIGFGMAGMNAASSGLNIANDPFATSAQKGRSLARMLPGGETAQRWADAFSGRAAGMELAAYHGQMAGANVQGGLEKSAFKLSYNPEQAGYAGTAAAYAGGSAVTAGVHNRGTSAGRTAYEDAQRLLPFRQATAAADREAAKATAMRVASEKELVRLKTMEQTLMKDQTVLQEKIVNGTSGVKQQVLLEQKKLVDEQVLGIGGQVRTAQQGLLSARRGEIGAKGEQQKARDRELLLGSAANLEARAERSEASASRLGGMNPAERQMGLQAIKMLEAGANPDALPPELKAAAQAFDPDAYGEAIKRHGVGTAEFKERQAAGKRGFEGDYAGLYKQSDTLKEQAGQAEYRTDTAMAQSISVVGSRMVDVIVDAFEKMETQLRSKLTTRFLDGRNATPG